MKLALINIAIDNQSPPIGLASIATYLKKYANFGNTVIIDINYDNILERIKEENPDIIGIGAMTVYYSEAIKLAKEIRKKYFGYILVGGNHISTLPESLNPIFDIGVIGEAEETMRELIEIYKQKKEFIHTDLENVKGIVYWQNNKLKQTERRPLIVPLDKIPIADRSLLNPECFKRHRNFSTGDYEIGFRIPTARGCPYRCKFCSPIVLWEGKTRLHSVDRIVEEVRIGMKQYGATFIKFSDDLFVISKERLIELRGKLRLANLLPDIKFSTTVRANLVDNELCELLKDLNVVSVNTGYESGNEDMLKWLKGGNVTVEDNKKAMLLFEKYGIPYCGSFIFGSPNETIAQMKDTLKLIKFAYKHHIRFAYVFLMKPLPGTVIWDIAKERNLVSNDMDWEGLSLFIEGMNEKNKPFMLDKSIDLKEFRKVHEKAIYYSRLLSFKKLLKTLARHPFLTIQDIGNPISFIKKNLIHVNTFKNIKDGV